MWGAYRSARRNVGKNFRSRCGAKQSTCASVGDGRKALPRPLQADGCAWRRSDKELAASSGGAEEFGDLENICNDLVTEIGDVKAERARVQDEIKGKEKGYRKQVRLYARWKWQGMERVYWLTMKVMGRFRTFVCQKGEEKAL